MTKLEELRQQISQLADNNPHKELLMMNLQSLETYKKKQRHHIKSSLKTTTHYRYG